MDPHAHDIVEAQELPSSMPVSAGWQPIETVPDGERVLLWWEHGERGNGGMETAYVFHSPGEPTGLSYWTHGGPNAGLDWTPRDNERPTHWMPLPAPPIP